MVKVLIAEDNVPISINLSNSINANPEVQAIAIVNEGTRVYTKIKATKPDILVLDLKMPGENGLQILDEITNDEELNNVKVVIYSGELDYIQRAVGYKNVISYLDKGRTTIADVSLFIRNFANNMESKSLNDEVLDRLVKVRLSTKKQRY